MLLDRLVIDVLGFGAFAAFIVAAGTAFGAGPRPFARFHAGVVLCGGAVAFLLAASVSQGFGLLIPDSAEYYGIARRLLFDGRTDLSVAGADVPSRYTPWFSWFFLYPIVRLGGDVPALVGLMAVFSFMGVIAGAMIARVLLPANLEKAAPWVGASLFLVPAYRHFSVQLMTDVPVTAIILVILAVFVNRLPEHAKLRELAALGVLAGFATSLRPLSVLVLVPLLHRYRVSRPGGAAAWTFLALPTAAVGVATAWYNHAVFGSAARSGYSLWTAVPYDYPWLIFNYTYVTQNLGSLVRDALFVPAALVVCAPRRLFGTDGDVVRSERRLLVFVVAGLLPVAIAHVLYFYTSVRFYLPLESALAIAASARVASLVGLRWFAATVAFVLCALVAIAPRIPQREDSAALDELVARTQQCAPADAMIVSTIHPVVAFERLARGTNRTIVPLSRSVELASKVLVRKSVPYPLTGPAVNPLDHRAYWLLDGGATEAFEFVALEDMGELARRVSTGSRAILIDYKVTDAERALITDAFDLTALCPGVLEIASTSNAHNVR